MSYRDEVKFSMIANDDEQHKDRLSFLQRYNAHILPIAAIYGGNASGKTNLFKALFCVKRLVTEMMQPDNSIPIDFFRLDPKYKTEPTHFCIEFLIDEVVYEFSFVADREMILEEKLVETSADSDDKILFHRKDNKVKFHSSLKDHPRLDFIFQGTIKNQLFITNAVFQNVEELKPIYDWFRYTLVLVTPNSQFIPFENFLNKSHHLHINMNDILPQLDTGISKLGGEDISFENIQISQAEKDKIQRELKEGDTTRFRGEGLPPITLTRKDGKVIAEKLVTYHKSIDGSEIPFEIFQESDGTQRVIDLLPAILEISRLDSRQIYVIDELDRSMHTHLTRKLIEGYLSNCTSENRSQLLFTTHDALLMNEHLLRNDELWLTERNSEGSSSLGSVSDYKDAQNDKDLQKSYLQGRLGGVPNFPLDDNFWFLKDKE